MIVPFAQDVDFDLVAYVGKDSDGVRGANMNNMLISHNSRSGTHFRLLVHVGRCADDDGPVLRAGQGRKLLSGAITLTVSQELQDAGLATVMKRLMARALHACLVFNLHSAEEESCG